MLELTLNFDPEFSGMAGFYKDPVAQLVVKEMEANDGLITLRDMADYKIVSRFIKT